MCIELFNLHVVSLVKVGSKSKSTFDPHYYLGYLKSPKLFFIFGHYICPPFFSKFDTFSIREQCRNFI
jgi:hypothetical protein